MTADLAPRTDTAFLAEHTRQFIRDVVLPVEDAADGDIEAAGGDALRIRLQESAREAGIFAPHAPVEFGGLGLGMLDRAAIFEAAGYSVFGPLALNIAAPDEGNVHLLAHTADDAQRTRYLAPLARGEVRSAFAMTEPPPGAGSDPAALCTRAEPVAGGWIVNGRKWFITGADGADFFIVIARSAGAPGDAGGATMFLADADTPGITVGRHIPTSERSMIGGHCEVDFTDLFVPDSGVLGEVDHGFAAAQIRLGPARMTHVMRWLGTARRAADIAIAQAAGRDGFGAKIGDLGLAQQLIADNEIDIAASRALLHEACRELDAGGRASNSTSIAKTFAAEAIGRVVDRAIQLCGGVGVSGDLPLSRLAAEVRPFRIYDGPSEVHRWAIARRAVRAGGRS